MTLAVDLHEEESLWTDMMPLPGLLLIDGDPFIPKVLKRFFEREGFQVWIATEHTSACAIFERHREEIDLVLLDVSSAAYDPQRVLRQLLELSPDLRCCLMTAGADQAVVDEMQQEQAVAQIFPRPLANIQIVLDGLREVLAR